MDFPVLKRSALILSLHATSEKLVAMKVKELRSRMWKLALVAGGVGAIPLPFASLMFDMTVVEREIKFYYTQLGLNEVSLERCARRNYVDVGQLKSIVDNSVGLYRYWRNETVQKFVLGLSMEYFLSVESAVEKHPIFLKLIGLIGTKNTFITASLGTYAALHLKLDQMKTVALEVMTYAAANAAMPNNNEQRVPIKSEL